MAAVLRRCAVKSDLAERARQHARVVAEEIFPTGTRAHDSVAMSRQAFENEFARAIVFGYELGKKERK